MLLENGFFPAQFLVYDRARIALLRLYRQLIQAGCVVYGVKTDCFVVDKLPADFPLAEDGRLLANMGKFHREPESKLADYDIFHCAQDDDNAPVHVSLAACREPVDCEVVEAFAGSGREFKFKEQPPIVSYDKFPYRELTAAHEFSGNALVVVEDGTMVLGDCAGSGKTTCCAAGCEGRTLVVVPSNKRVDEFEVEWLNTQKERAGELPEFVSKFPPGVTDVVVMTTAQFLGKRISEEGGEKKVKTSKLPELADFDSIFIDEFFQSSAWDIIAMTRRLVKLRAEQTPADKEKLRLYGIQLDSIRATERRLPDADDTRIAELRAELETMRAALFPKRTKVFANGDTFQLTNQESWNALGDKQEFCDTFLWRVVPRCIRLRENFRLTDPAERPVLMNVLRQLKLGLRCDEETGEALESTRGFILRVLRDNGLAGQVFTDPAFVERGGKPMPCIAWSNVMGNAINQRFSGDEAVGMEVVCRAYMMKKVTDKETGVAKKVGLRMNKVYKALSIKDGYYGSREDDKPDTPVKLYPRLKFRRNIAQTAHAVQGETIARDFAIFEFGSNPDWRWVYVSASRASSLR